ncbi:MAG: hypothetical protein KDC28_02265 [Saprospiraceae bacterium]|nr:hypothetical protein [Saprospiraceae bacterium]MCB9319774.1 hypothetical protein [Lewinellaceae bacterium]
MAKSHWSKGRGKLGILKPLLGHWKAEADSPMGRIKCTRAFTSTLGDHYIQMTVHWQFTSFAYTEHAILGMGNGVLTFWSFTSDGKNSTGTLADGTDIHPEAICFEAQMPAGLARMIYWPDESDGFYWAVESKNKKGWKRFTLHHYLPEQLSQPDYSIVD